MRCFWNCGRDAEPLRLTCSDPDCSEDEAQSEAIRRWFKTDRRESGFNRLK